MSTAGTDPTWIPREFPEYERSSVVYEAYDARSLDQGAYFVVAFPGPYEEIPDLSIKDRYAYVGHAGESANLDFAKSAKTGSIG